MTNNELQKMLHTANQIKDGVGGANDEQNALVAAAVIVGFAHLTERIEEKLDEVISQIEYTR